MFVTGWLCASQVWPQYFLHPRYMVRAKKYDEMFWLGLRHVLAFKYVFAGFTWPLSVALFVLYIQGGSSYIFTNFAMSHTHLPVTQPDEFLHWVDYAAVHTTNITGCIPRLAAGGESSLNAERPGHGQTSP